MNLTALVDSTQMAVVSALEHLLEHILTPNSFLYYLQTFKHIFILYFPRHEAFYFFRVYRYQITMGGVINAE